MLVLRPRGRLGLWLSLCCAAGVVIVVSGRLLGSEGVVILRVRTREGRIGLEEKVVSIVFVFLSALQLS